MNVAVLMGGTSEERHVSLATGRAVVDGLRARGHTVRAVDTARGYVPREEEARVLSSAVGVEPPARAELAEVRRGALSIALVELPVLREADVIFLALHGGDGENGRLQAVLDVAGLRYTGGGYLGAALAWDKRISKEVMAASGIPTPAWAPAGAGAEEILDLLGLPLVVKPARGGSTVGLSVVRTVEELAPALRVAATLDPDVLVERYVSGRELTVTVLGEEALPVIEIVPGNGIYDYESKYTPGMSEYRVPAPLPTAEAEELGVLALRAHAVLRQRSYSRVDFLRAEDGTFTCLEVNTLPGMTSTSLVPKAAAAVGISFPELCERIARDAALGTDA